MKAEITNLETTGSKKHERRPAGLFRRQLEEVRGGGPPALRRKCSELLMILLAMPAALIIRALRPLVLIRTGQLVSERIGHFAANTEMYLCRRDAGLDNRRAIDIFYTAPSVSNRQLKKMWGRALHICRLAGPLDKANRSLPGSHIHTINLVVPGGDRDTHGLLANSKPHLSFTGEEERRGLAALRQLGVPDGARFICFCSRDPAYLKATTPEWDCRHLDYRDSNIHRYVPAEEEMARRGYYSLRMGAIVQEALSTTNPMIIDYATRYRSDFMDIFLNAKGYFAIYDTVGLNAIPKIFRRPVAYVNIVPLEHAPSWLPDDLFIPKLLRKRDEHRFLSFREMLDITAGRFPTSEDYEKLGIEVVENTPEEITDLAVEMDERLAGRWQTTGEDEDLQRRFWSLFKGSPLHGIVLSRIGARFLRRNARLLE